MSTGWENMKTIGWPTPTAIPGEGKTLAVTMLAGGAVVKLAKPLALKLATPVEVAALVAGPASVPTTT